MFTLYITVLILVFIGSSIYLIEEPEDSVQGEEGCMGALLIGIFWPFCLMMVCFYLLITAYTRAIVFLIKYFKNRR